MKDPKQLKTTDSRLPSDVIVTVTENYSSYYELTQIVKSWQKWYNDQKKIYEEVK